MSLPRPHGRAAAALLSVLVPALAAVSQTAEEGDQPPAETFAGAVDVRVVNVEVVVTRDGQPVSGLTAADFLLQVDGAAVPIEFFHEVREGRTLAAPEGPAATEVAEADDGTDPPGTPAATHYLIVVDDIFGVAAYRNQFLIELAKQLDELEPVDRVAVARLSASGAEMWLPWTDSRSRIRDVFDRLAAEPAGGLRRMVDRRRLLEPEELLSQRMLEALYADDERQREIPRPSGREWEPGDDLALAQTREAATLAATVLERAGRPPGRRVALLALGPWWVPHPPGAAVYPLVDAANRLGYTLYPADNSLRQVMAGTSAERRDHNADDPFGAAKAEFAQAVERQLHVENGLVHLAEETGGKALLGGGRFVALERAVGDTRSYYSLGFSAPADAAEGRHQIEVTVRTPGTKVRHRRSYYDLPAEGRSLVELVRAGSMTGSLEEARLTVTLGDLQEVTESSAVLPVRLEIPLDAIELSERDGQLRADLELFVLVSGPDGRGASLHRPLRLRGPGPLPAGASLPFDASFEIGRGDYVLLATVFDPRRRRLLSGRRNVHF